MVIYSNLPNLIIHDCTKLTNPIKLRYSIPIFFISHLGPFEGKQLKWWYLSQDDQIGQYSLSQTKGTQCQFTGHGLNWPLTMAISSKPIFKRLTGQHWPLINHLKCKCCANLSGYCWLSSSVFFMCLFIKWQRSQETEWPLSSNKKTLTVIKKAKLFCLILLTFPINRIWPPAELEY